MFKKNITSLGGLQNLKGSGKIQVDIMAQSLNTFGSVNVVTRSPFQDCIYLLKTPGLLQFSYAGIGKVSSCH